MKAESWLRASCLKEISVSIRKRSEVFPILPNDSWRRRKKTTSLSHLLWSSCKKERARTTTETLVVLLHLHQEKLSRKRMYACLVVVSLSNFSSSSPLIFSWCPGEEEGEKKAAVDTVFFTPFSWMIAEMFVMKGSSDWGASSFLFYAFEKESDLNLKFNQEERKKVERKKAEKDVWKEREKERKIRTNTTRQTVTVACVSRSTGTGRKTIGIQLTLCVFSTE